MEFDVEMNSRKSWRRTNTNGRGQEKPGAEALWWAQLMQKYHFLIHYFQRMTLSKVEGGEPVSISGQVGETREYPAFTSCPERYVCIA